MLLTIVVVSAVPAPVQGLAHQVATELLRKFEPFTVRVNIALNAGVVVGEIDVTTGIGVVTFRLVWLLSYAGFVLPLFTLIAICPVPAYPAFNWAAVIVAVS